jgi:hypothetical protein
MHTGALLHNVCAMQTHMSGCGCASLLALGWACCSAAICVHAHDNDQLYLLNDAPTIFHAAKNAHECTQAGGLNADSPAVEASWTDPAAGPASAAAIRAS